MGGSLAKLELPAQDITDATYDANNRLTKWGGKTFSYDANGNLTGDGVSTYQWDERGQLKQILAGTTPTASFQYDADGRRSAKTINGQSTGYVYDGGNFVQELAGSANTSAVKAQLVTGLSLDETFLREEGTQLQSLLPDGNNNTIMLTDQSQTKIAGYSYEPYGKTTQDGSSTNSQQYTGRENDDPSSANGLYYYRARYFMPGTGRLISEDPIGWASGQTNNFTYVGGNPLSKNDPLGLAETCGGTDCANPPFDPSPNGPTPAPAPTKPPQQPNSRCHPLIKWCFGGCTCADTSTNLVACYACCKTVPGFLRSGGGTICQTQCNDKYPASGVQ